MRLLVFLGLCVPLLATASDPLQQALELGRETHRQLAAKQTRIEQLDDEQQRLASEYARLQQRIRAQREYLQRLRDKADAQQREHIDLEEQTRELGITRGQLSPLLQRMVATLGEVVATDLPFAGDERRQRHARLEGLLKDVDITETEKLRRVLEAYQVEVDYGYRLEVERRPLPSPESAGGDDREVDLIRLGRVALFYLTLDRGEAGYWQREQRSWRELPISFIPSLQQALRTAKKQAAPELLVLPLPVQSGSQSAVRSPGPS